MNNKSYTAASLLLFFIMTGQLRAQFNTAVYTPKYSKEVIQQPVTHSGANFIPYPVTYGTSEKKGAKHKRNKEKIKTGSSGNLPVESSAQEKKPELQMKDVVTDHQDSEVPSSRIVYRRLPFIEEPIEVQRVFMPVSSIRITSGYGMRFHPVDNRQKFHNGIDIAARYVPVHAVLDGVVSEAGYSSGNGNYIKIEHGIFETIYLHLNRFHYLKGDRVSAGDIIGISGNTGKSTGPHLHFAVKQNGQYVNPVHFLNDLIHINNTLTDNENRSFTHR